MILRKRDFKFSLRKNSFRLFETMERDYPTKLIKEQTFFYGSHNGLHITNSMYHSRTMLRSSLIYNTSARHERHECDTSATPTTECDTNATRTTRVRHELKNFDFDNDTSKNIFHIPIFTIWQVKDYTGNASFPY